MRRWFAKFILIVLGVAVAVYPTLYARELEQHAHSFAALFAALIATSLFMQFQHEAAERKQLERVSNRLKVQEGRSATLKSMIDLLTDPIVMIEGEDQTQWTPEDRKEACDYLNRAMSTILKAISKEIADYWGQKDDDHFNANLMVAHTLGNCSPDELNRLSEHANFLGYKRDFRGYPQALELALWGKPESDIPPLVLPVEDPKDVTGRRKLLPGAPTALALGRDQFIPDTRKILEYIKLGADDAGADLDHDVLLKLDEYFKSHSFRSFASLVLKDSNKEHPIGVVNIQSEEVGRFQKDNVDVETLINSLEHYRFCLEYILTGQRKIVGLAS
jgi:hypothetical protein